MSTIADSVIEQSRQLSDLTERGLAVYEDSLRAALQKEHWGAIVAIEPYTGDYAIGADSDGAVQAIRAQNVKGRVFVRRIGTPTEEDDRLEARGAASESKRQ